jgi:hypothetical protein
MADQLEHQADALAALLLAGDHAGGERALDGLRETTWHRRAGEIRARRHAGPGARRASPGRAVPRRKPRPHDLTAGEASGEIAAGRRRGA